MYIYLYINLIDKVKSASFESFNSWPIFPMVCKKKRLKKNTIGK